MRLTLILFIIFSQSGLLLGQFVNLASQNNMNLINNNPLFGNGVAFYDFDHDGFDDITYGTKNQGIQFWKNNGNDAFVPLTISFTPTIPLNIDIKTVLWVDYDNDGDEDFIYTGILTAGLGNYPMKVYKNNGNFQFTDVSIAIGILPETPQMFGVSAGDYDRDGWLDLYVCKYHNADFFEGYEYSNRLYHNNGDGTFSDVTLTAGLPTPIQASFCCVFMDYDRDGWQDIYVINDRFNYPNYLYHNLGDGTFEDVTATSGAGIYIEAMSSTVGDYDRDGDQDVFVSNTNVGNVLLNNLGDGTFADAADYAGVVMFKVCWGALWLDYDNNGWEDLFVPTVGFGVTMTEANMAWHNNEDGTFTDVTEDLGLGNNNDGTYCTSMGDYNNDGYYDFIQNNTGTATDFYANSGGGNNYFCATFEGTISNKAGIGTWIDCWSTNGYQNRYTFSNEAYMGQCSNKEIFGLGSATSIDSLKIYWLNGLIETYYDISVNQCQHFVEGASTSGLAATVNYEGDLFLCPGESIQFTCENAESYVWSTGANEQNITISEPDTISVVILNQYGIEQISTEYIVQWAPSPEWTESESDVTCAGLSDGSANITFNLGDITSILWESGQETFEITNLSAATYVYTFIDGVGCTHIDSVLVEEPEELIIELSTSDALCFEDNSGTAEVLIFGGNGDPYTINWGEGVDPNSLYAGEYTALVTDPLNCQASEIFTISEPTELTATVTATVIDVDNPYSDAEVEISGGTNPYSAFWSNGEEGELLVDSLNSGFNSIVVIDNNGCSVEVVFEVLVGIQEYYDNHVVSIYPNPTSQDLSISSELRFDKLVLRDSYGNIIWDRKISPTHFLVSNTVGLAKGIYCLNVYAGESLLSIEKIVVSD
jgi:hypothetical protein